MDVDATTRVGPGVGVHQTLRDLDALTPIPRLELVLIGLGSGVSGLVETGVLLIVARVALAGSDGTVGLPVLGTLEIAQALGAAGALLAVVAVLRVTSERLLARTVARMNRQLADHVVDAFVQAEWETQAGMSAGYFITLLTKNAGRVTDLLQQIVVAYSAALAVLAYLAVGLLVNPAIVIIVGAVGGLSALLLRPLRRGARHAAADATRATRAFAITAVEVAMNALEVKTAGREESVLDLTSGLTAQLEQPVGRSIWLRRVTTVLQLLALLGVGVLILALVRVSAVANLTEVGAVALIALRAVQQTHPIQTAAHVFNDGAPYVSELREAVDRFEDSRATRGTIDVDRFSSLELDDVSFSYDGEGMALRSVSVRFEPGRSVAILGPSGSGKSTLAQLLLNLRTPSSGEIRLNGQPARGVSRQSWTRLAAFVPQEARIFTASVCDNVTLFDPTVPRSEVIRALEIAHLTSEVEALEGGLDTVIGDRGVRNLSGGQRQRLALARALVRHPELVILDEPTSSLDPYSERAISEALVRLKDELTLVIIAHRFATVQQCDTLLVLDSGRVVDKGPRERVLSRNTFVQAMRDGLEVP